jgi:hypothetical protein
MIKGTALKRKKPLARGTSTLKRTGFQKKASVPAQWSSLKRSTKRLQQRRSTTKPTAEEKAWMDFVAKFGCVVCWLLDAHRVKCSVHHILQGGRRRGHLYTIGLCDPGHHQHDTRSGKIGRHPYKKRFEQAYGSEYELLGFLQGQYKLRGD